MRTHLATAAAMLLSGVAAADSRPHPLPSTRTVSEIYFAFDSAHLTSDAWEDLAAVARALRSEPTSTVVLRGFADPRGAGDYNVGLSARRTQAVRAALTRLAIDPDRIVLTFYGEDAPPRDSYALDRRVAIRLTADPLHVIVDRTLEGATGLVWNEPVSGAVLEGRANPVASR